MTALRLGHGTEPDVDVGPLIDAAQRDKVAALVDDAVAKGAVLRTGGSPCEGAGFFYPPTVLTDVPATARLSAEEVFGPVAAVSTFRSESEVIAAANDTEYGLAGYLFTRDLARATRAGEALETGMVGINQGLVSNPAGPFGGVKHDSGLGREGGDEGLDEYLDTKYLAVAV